MIKLIFFLCGFRGGGRVDPRNNKRTGHTNISKLLLDKPSLEKKKWVSGVVYCIAVR